MLIKSLLAPGFKGKEIRQSLKSSNLITADPFSGKTAISDAIRIGMYGSVTSLGETNEKTFKLCSDPAGLFVRLTFDNGQENHIAINRKDDGFTRSESLSVKFPKVLMDVDEYFGGTEQQRLQYVLDRCNMKKVGYDEADLLNEFGFQNIKMEDPNFAIIQKWRTAITDSITQRDRTKSSVSLWMETLLQRFKKVRDKELKISVKDLQAQIKGIRGQVEPKDVSARKAELEKDLIDLKAKQASKTADKVNESARDLADCLECINEIKEDLGRIESEEISMRKKDYCPVCKNKGRDWLKAWESFQEARKAPLEKEIKELQKKEKELQAKADSKPKSDRADRALENNIADLEEDIDSINRDIRAHTAWEANQETLKCKEEALKQAQAEMAVIDGLIKVLVKYQSVIVEKAFKLLLKTANEFTDGILLSPLEYHGELGRKEQGVWVSHEVFSGTEKLITYSGIQVALCQDSPMRIVIMDEFSRMPPKYQLKVSKRLEELVEAGTIDQWIAITWDVSWLPSNSKINVIRL